MNWNQSFLDYAEQIGRQYKVNPEKTLKEICFDSVLGCLLETYQCFVRQNEMLKLEDLAPDHKEALWIKSKQYSDDKEKRIMICKVIYLLDLLTK
jgi:hypothetical protein